MSSGPTPGVFFNGDNLAVLRFIDDESVDLIYLDPPFNSQRNYNAIFKGAKAQERAFKDCWSWEDDAAKTYERLMAGGYDAPSRVVDLMRALKELLGPRDLMAYLTMMSVRLVELHRVLKRTGSLYLHCDTTASHYLKVILDAIFVEGGFQSEVVWKRSSAHSGAKKWGPIHDTIFFYAKTGSYTWNQQYTAEATDNIEKWYVHKDERGRYKRGDLTGAGVRSGASGEPWRGFDPTKKGRHWAVPREIVNKLNPSGRDLTPQESLDLLFEDGRIIWPKKVGGQPMLKRYKHEAKGVPAGDVIADIPPLSLSTHERTKYPTQKPVALLERILKASSSPGDLVLDPFCGCGTTIEAAQRLGRRWIGIDIADVAVDVLRERLEGAFPGLQYAQHFIPPDVAAARRLAQADRNEFQWWALSLIGAYAPNSTTSRGRTGADRGVDGEIRFRTRDGERGKAMVSVKSGGTSAPHVRDFGRVIDRERAALGVFVTLNAPTKPMETEALDCGFIDGPNGEKIRKLQILTVEDIMEGRASVRLPGDLIKPQSLPPPFAMPALQAALFNVPPAPAVPKIASPKKKRQEKRQIPYRPFDIGHASDPEPATGQRVSRVSEIPGIKRASPSSHTTEKKQKARRRARR